MMELDLLAFIKEVLFTRRRPEPVYFDWME